MRDVRDLTKSSSTAVCLDSVIVFALVFSSFSSSTFSGIDFSFVVVVCASTKKFKVRANVSTFSAIIASEISFNLSFCDSERFLVIRSNSADFWFSNNWALRASTDSCNVEISVSLASTDSCKPLNA